MFGAVRGDWVAMLAAGAVAVTACAPSRTDPPMALRLGCDTAAPFERLFESPAARIVLIGSEGENGVAAFAQSICHAAARGERVQAAIASAAALGSLKANMARWTAAGAQIALVMLPAAAHESPAQAEAAAQIMAISADTDRTIVLVDAEAAARSPIGLSGETWRPLGAHLPADRSVSLLLLDGVRPGMRISLRPFEDVPEMGAARVYDGLIEAGPAPPAAPSTGG